MREYFKVEGVVWRLNMGQTNFGSRIYIRQFSQLRFEEELGNPLGQCEELTRHKSQSVCVCVCV